MRRIDHLTKKERSEAMRKVGIKNTPAEKIVKQEIRKIGRKFTSNSKKLPGKPDIVIADQRKVVFVNGCFWHFHTCKSLPITNRSFWKSKFQSNKSRDRRVIRELNRSGWKVLTVWECWKKRPSYLQRRLSAFLCN